jgi:hypothetical protein
VLGDELRERGIRRHVVRPRYQARITPQDFANGARVQLENPAQLIAGLLRVLPRDWLSVRLNRQCRRRAASRRRGLKALLRASRSRVAEPDHRKERGNEEALRHICIYG